jgi:hypothetical protein
MSANEQQKAMGKVVSRAWSDPAFKERLLSNPGEVLRESGIPVPQGLTIKVHEDGPSLRNIVLPVKTDVLTDEQLDMVADGGDPVPLTITAVVPT